MYSLSTATGGFPRASRAVPELSVAEAAPSFFAKSVNAVTFAPAIGAPETASTTEIATAAAAEAPGAGVGANDATRAMRYSRRGASRKPIGAACTARGADSGASTSFGPFSCTESMIVRGTGSSGMESAIGGAVLRAPPTLVRVENSRPWRGSARSPRSGNSMKRLFPGSNSVWSRLTRGAHGGAVAEFDQAIGGKQLRRDADALFHRQRRGARGRGDQRENAVLHPDLEALEREDQVLRSCE